MKFLRIKNSLTKIALLISISFTTSFAQIPNGGTDLLTNATSAGTIYDATSTAISKVVSITGQTFISAREIQIVTQPTNYWEAQFQFKPSVGIASGDVLLFAFYARTTASRQETGEGIANAVLERNSGNYDKVLSQNFSIGNEWKQYFVAFSSNLTLASSEMNMSFQLGFSPQTIQFADIRLINYKNTKTIAVLPKTEITYVGRESNAAWRAEAETRIEQIRKGDLEIIVKDQNGDLINGATVSVTMNKHKYGFGSAIDGSYFLSSKKYRDTVLKLFNQVTLENDLKWPFWNKTNADAYVTYLNNIKMDIRGHVLVWPSWRNSPTYLKQYENNPSQLRTEINNHITEMVTNYKGKLLDWDVLNEPYDNFDFMNVLGRKEMAEWYKQVKSIEPNSRLFINDYSILSAGGLDLSHQNAYFNTIIYIDSLGGNIEGIGMQGHFSSQLTPITRIYTILDRFAALKKDIKITEFDIDITDEDAQADYTRDLMTQFFSHPSTTAFVMWGFWEGRHWKPNGAMYRNDWTAKKNLSAYKDLVFNKWWTKTFSKSSDLNGIATERVFLGEYEIKATFNGKSVSKTEMISKNVGKNTVEIVLPLVASISDLNIENKSFTVYPNPSNTSFTIESKKRVRVEMINIKGHEMETAEGLGKIPIGKNAPSGVYVLKIRFEDGSTKIETVTKH